MWPNIYVLYSILKLSTSICLKLRFIIPRTLLCLLPFDEVGRLFRVVMLIVVAGVTLRDVAHYVNKSQVVGGSMTFAPHEFIQVAGIHFLGCPIILLNMPASNSSPRYFLWASVMVSKKFLLLFTVS